MLLELELKTMANILEIKDLHAGIDGKEILKGVNLTMIIIFYSSTFTLTPNTFVKKTRKTK